MEKLRKNIIGWYSSLTSQQKLKISIIGLVILISFYLIFIRNSYRQDEINYKNISNDSIIQSSYMVYDRNIILTLDEIIEKILKVETNEYRIKDKQISINTLYKDAVSYNYKKNITKKQFKNKMNLVYEKVLNNENYNAYKNYIQEVYFSEQYDMYLIRLNTCDDSEIYIGIKIIDDYFYNIVYFQ